MGLFFNRNKLDKPVILKEDTSCIKQITQLEGMLNQKKYSAYSEQIKADLLKLQSGLNGENNVGYYLKNSGIPMYILHDVYLEYNSEYRAQIDFIVITRKYVFVIECKNYSYSTKIIVDSTGQFIISQKDNTTQSMKNPVEQNRIHMEIIKKISPEISRICYPVTVFANEKSILDCRNAPDNIKSHITRADNLVNFITVLIKKSNRFELSDRKMKEYAEFFLAQNKDNPVDYTTKYTVPETAKVTGNIRCICPNCSQPVPKEQYFCKCGMQFSIYRTKLTDGNIKSLLNGNKIRISTDYGDRIVFPEIESHEHNGKTFYQWQSVKFSEPVKAPDNTRCICPNCSRTVPKDHYFCQCGMQFSIYRTKLTDNDIKSLVNGEKVKISTAYGDRIVSPELESREYNGRTLFQWKSAPAK